MERKPRTVDEYLARLPEDRRAALSAVRSAIRAGLDEGYEEGIQYGMIGYYVPHRLFPDGYHADPKQPLPFAGLASQKHHMSIYLMSIYCRDDKTPDTRDATWLREAWARRGKKLDMGKSCIRFKRIDDVPLEVITEVIRRVPASDYVERYRKARSRRGTR